MKRLFSSAIFLILLFALQQAAQPQSPASPYWTGDGGSGRSITILPPKGAGLAKEQAYLPDFVANELVSNFRNFSAMTLFDRVSNQRQYDELLSGIYDDKDKAGLDLGHLASTDYMLLGNITKTSTGYALQLTVNKNSDKTTAATYSGPVSIAELDSLTAVRRASLDLLQKMGVTLTAQARNELTKAAAENRVIAQTASAQSITAQRQGNEVAAMMYANMAALYDPSLFEAVSRSSILTANISSNSIGDKVRNDIRVGDEWEARLKETEQVFNKFFDNFFKTLPPMPYTLFYYSDVRQVGEPNRQNRTVTLSGITTNLHASQGWALSAEPPLQAAQKSVQTVLDGLNETRRKTAWGLDKWPQQGAFNRALFGRQAKNFTVVIELVNDRNQVIGRETFQTGGSYEFPVPLPGGGTRIQVAADEQKTVNFNNVKADDITENMTVRVASVNGIPAETAAKNGVLQIIALSKKQWDFNKACVITNGVITKYNGNGGAIVIDNNIWGEPFTSIGKSAFEKKQLTSVVIGNGVTSIGNEAFSSNQLTSVTIPNSVTSIGNRAFSSNQLTSVTIPNSITFIGDGAFADNRLTSITIPDSVTSIGNRAFSSNHLTGVTIPNSVTSIGEGAFADNLLTSVTIPNSVTSIGNWAFSSYYPLTSVENRVYSSNHLTGVTIPDSVTSIGEGAFAYNRLTSVTIPNSVISIEKEAFSNNQLTSVTIGNGVKTIGERVFVDNQLTSVTIGVNVMIVQDAFSILKRRKNIPGITWTVKDGNGNVTSSSDDIIPKSIGFVELYNRNGKKAGVYTRRNANSTRWSYAAR